MAISERFSVSRSSAYISSCAMMRSLSKIVSTSPLSTRLAIDCIELLACATRSSIVSSDILPKTCSLTQFQIRCMMLRIPLCLAFGTSSGSPFSRLARTFPSASSRSLSSGAMRPFAYLFRYSSYSSPSTWRTTSSVNRASARCFNTWFFIPAMMRWDTSSGIASSPCSFFAARITIRKSLALSSANSGLNNAA